MKKLFHEKNDDSKKKPSAEEKAFANKETIVGQLEHLSNIGQESFALYLLRRDPIQGKISPEDTEEIIRESIKCGHDEALKLLNEFEGLSALEIAKELNLDVKFKGEPGTLEFVYFGLYEEPNQISIYENNISKARDLIEKLGIDAFKEVSFEDIVLAHEIFHHFEVHDETLYPNTKRINLWSIGNLYTHTSPLVCTGEIAGMSFAKTLLKLEFDPTLLDYIFLLAHDFEQADKLYQKIVHDIN